MRSIVTSTLHLHQFLTTSTPQSALIAHGRHEDTTPKQATTASPTEETPARDKGVKRRRVVQVSNTSPSDFSSDTDDSSGASSEGVCNICDQRQPPSEIHRSISKWSKVNWIGCEKCDRWFHQCCTELPKTTDVSSIQFVCHNCK